MAEGLGRETLPSYPAQRPEALCSLEVSRAEGYACLLPVTVINCDCHINTPFPRLRGCPYTPPKCALIQRDQSNVTSRSQLQVSPAAAGTQITDRFPLSQCTQSLPQCQQRWCHLRSHPWSSGFATELDATFQTSFFCFSSSKSSPIPSWLSLSCFSFL